MSLSTIDLSTYVLTGRHDLPEPTRTAPPVNSVLAQEVSAVTYDWDTDTLFVIGDGGTSIVQVSKTGQLIDSMTLAPGGSPQGTEFYDPEGLTYIGGGKFVMAEERDRQIVQFTYVAGTTLTRAAAETVKLGTFVGNIGLEGLSYDPLTNGYILVKEKTPKSIFQTNIDFVAHTATNGSPTTDNSVALFDSARLNLLDLADVFALSNLTALGGTAQASHLLVLSQESGKIVNVDRAGNVHSSLTIVSNPPNALSVADQQHEGLTMGADGTLYVVSENGGGDFNRPQLWVYTPSLAINQAPTALALNNQLGAILENTSTAERVKVADVAITDDGLGNNSLIVTGADAAFFEVANGGLYIKAGTTLDFETKTSYSVTVSVDDATVGAAPDVTAAYTLLVTNVVNEDPAHPTLYISEVAPWSSGSSPVAVDWFEVTNAGATAVDITGWKMDDNSVSFGAAAALSGITSIAAGQSVIFLETRSLASVGATFLTTWFGANPPAGLHLGSYSGAGVGLSTGGDHVNLFDAAGTLQASLSFGASPAGSLATFNNAGGLNHTTISKFSATGGNGAFAAANHLTEIGSPGSVGKLFISEVAPWSSGNSPVGADWFEVTNTTAFAVDITGWKMDDNSGSAAAAVALTGITSIAAGESVIFLETSNLPTTKAAFLSNWFGGNLPANLQIGNYSGAGVGLGAGGDAVNLYSAGNVLQASVALGASPTGTFATFENAGGLNGVTLTRLSAAGTNSAFVAVNRNTETGSPGEISPINDAPVAVDDSLSGIAEDAGSRAISFASLLVNDLAGTAEESGQSLTIISVGNAVGGSVSISGTDVIFASTLDFNGTASFDYTVQDNGTTYGLSAFLNDVGRVTFGIAAVNDAPAITATATMDVAENPLAVNIIMAVDPEADSITYAIVGGDDQAFFAVDALTGALAFHAAPDFETPGDANQDNIYQVTVSAIDNFGAASAQSISVTVTDMAEPGQVITGTRGNDVLTGGSGDHLISAGSGNDQVDGGDGADSILGGNGNDGLIGGKGNDSLSGEFGNDSLDGGAVTTGWTAAPAMTACGAAPASTVWPAASAMIRWRAAPAMTACWVAPDVISFRAATTTTRCMAARASTC